MPAICFQVFIVSFYRLVALFSILCFLKLKQQKKEMNIKNCDKM